MTREEFNAVHDYLAAGCGKVLESPQKKVYFDLLGDLAAATFLLAAKRVLLKHRYATFPTIAELREAAALSAAGEVTALSSAEAWEIAWKAIANTDPEVDGSFARATAGLPAIIVRAIQVFGLNALCYGTEPLTVVRAQFMRVYEQLALREREVALLPESTRKAIAGEARPTLPAKSASAVAGWLPPAPPSAK